MKYLSIDTEATGLTQECQLIQLAFVPVDTATRQVRNDLSVEWLVQCPSFEELKPTLNEWVVQNNEGLIRKAHSDGVPIPELAAKVLAYLKSPEITGFFNGKARLVFLGKSLSALDIPLLTRTFGEKFMQTNFHHHTVDVTCTARYLVDAGVLPPGCESTSQILKHFGVREDARHTALSDAVDMAEVYLKLLDVVAASRTGTAPLKPGANT